jgi:hypothetical protein
MPEASGAVFAFRPSGEVLGERNAVRVFLKSRNPVLDGAVKQFTLVNAIARSLNQRFRINDTARKLQRNFRFGLILART